MRRLVAQRPVLAKGADRAIDDTRVARRDRVIADTEPRNDARTERLHDHIRLVRELQERRKIILVLEVERDGSFAPRDVAEPDRRSVGRARAHGAHRLTDSILRLDHDHIRAMIGHGHGQMRPRKELRQVEDANAGELHDLILSERVETVIVPLTTDPVALEFEEYRKARPHRIT